MALALLLRPEVLAEPGSMEPPAQRDFVTRISAPIAPSPFTRPQRARPPVDRFTLGFEANRMSPAFAVRDELRALRARALPIDSAQIGFIPLTDDAGRPLTYDSLPPIEPPGICLPAGEGIRAYVDIDLGLEPDDERDEGDRGWSAGVAIDF